MFNLFSVSVMLFCPFMVVSYLLSRSNYDKMTIYGGGLLGTVMFCAFMETIKNPALGEIIVILLGISIGTIFYALCWKAFVEMLTKPNDVGFSAWPIFGIIIPIVGMWVGWKYSTLGATSPIPTPITTTTSGKFDNFSTEQLIDFIDDNSTGSSIASNSAWLKNNWHNLNYEQKVFWVKARESHLKIRFRSVDCGIAFVKAIQDADKDFIRGKAS